MRVRQGDDKKLSNDASVHQYRIFKKPIIQRNLNSRIDHVGRDLNFWGLSWLHFQPLAARAQVLELEALAFSELGIARHDDLLSQQGGHLASNYGSRGTTAFMDRLPPFLADSPDGCLDCSTYTVRHAINATNELSSEK